MFGKGGEKMKILAIDSSATVASVAVLEDDKIISHFSLNTGFTHSQTLLPMVESALDTAKITIDNIDLIAVSNGPGSFTGVRIGVATAKGLAYKNNTDCVGVSTLEAMAMNFQGEENTVIFAVMDARRMQVYNAVFEINNDKITRICDDRPISINDLKADLEKYSDKKIIFVGDGAKLCYNELKNDFPSIKLANGFLRYQDAYGVAMAAKNSTAVKGENLMPTYLRLAQAQRELKLKRGE